MTPKALYHVTRWDIAGKIVFSGLRIRKARRAKRIWFCTPQYLKWTIFHVAKTHHWDVGDLRAFKIYRPFEQGKVEFKHHRRGIYYTTRSLGPYDYATLGEQVLFVRGELERLVKCLSH